MGSIMQRGTFMLEIISEGPPQFGSSMAYSDAPEDYEGVCAVRDAGGSDKLIAVLPNISEARRVAAYAITPDGGWCFVQVSAAPGMAVTHNSFMEWM